MKVIKGIFVYTMIIIGALLGVGILLLGSMYLFKIEVFGYRFLNVNISKQIYDNLLLNSYYSTSGGDNVKYLDSCKVDGKYYVKFVVNSDDYSIRFVPYSEGNYVSYYVMNDFTGFVKSSTKQFRAAVNITSSIDANNTLVFNVNVSNPTGLLSFDKTESRIVIGVPEKYNNAYFYYDMDLTTNKGNITLTNSVTSTNQFDCPLNVNSLTASTNGGNITLGGFEREIDDVASTDKVTVYKAKSTATLNGLVLTTKGGTIDFRDFKSLTIRNKFVLESTKADYIFENLTAENGMEVLGTNVLLKANILTCNGDFVYKSDTGGIEVNYLNAGEYSYDANYVEGKYRFYETESNKSKLHNVSIFSESTNITIGAVMGKARIDNEYGKIKIGYLCNQASITNANGDITITKSGVLPNTLTKDGEQTTSTSSIVAYNTYGNISVGEYRQNGYFQNVKGKTTLYSKAASGHGWYTNVESKDGNIELKTDGSSYHLVGTDKANVTVTLNAIYSDIRNDENNDYYAKTSSGTLSITLPTDTNDVGYLVNVKGAFASKPTGTFSNLVVDKYFLYGQTNAGEVKTADVADALANYPLVKLEGKKIYVYGNI